jgi:hypothetical protein
VNEPEWLRQVWFAGNHSDIGGSYSENESRLSDIALQWMEEQATSVPFPLVLDQSRLHLFPSAAGMQHSEVEEIRDLYPRWWPARWRFSWSESTRAVASEAQLHPTVEERFKLPTVSQFGIPRPYRPENLRLHPKFAAYYAKE